jgi:hypothetical protein
MALPDENKGRPGEKAAPAENLYGDASLYANHILRAAWLTVHAERMYDIDTGGLLSAQLLDLRDLLEACEARGCWK